MENKQKIKTVSRIYRDLKEIETNPIQGLSICMPDENDPFSLHGNILILSGIYEGIMLHFIMTIPENYPITAPQMKICSGQKFDNSFHHHVFKADQGYTICIDLLDHGFFGQNEKTGWTAAYTLSTILIQMQVFFAEDHDLHQIPTQQKINDLKANLKNYRCSITMTDGTKKTHSVASPYPAITSVAPPKAENEEKKIDLEEEKKKRTYEKLTCFLTRMTPDENESPLGYPLYLKRDNYNRIDILPIMEMLSYDGYLQQVQNDPYKLDDYDNTFLRTANGENFNYWIPIYVNETMYKKFRQIILNSISVLKFGIVGKKEYDFDAELILKIYPTMMNKMIVALQSGALYQSVAAIEGYCHFLRLFLRLLEDFPELVDRINEKVRLSMQDDFNRNKTNLGDMGEFIILLSLSKYGFNDKNVLISLVKELIARKFLWFFKEFKSAEYKRIFFENELEILKESPLSLFHGMTIENLKKFYKQRKISNDLLLFNFAAVKKFLSNKQEFIKKMDENYGVISEKDIDEFLVEVITIKNNIKTYEELLQFIGLKEEFSDSPKILALFREAHQLSYMQGYTYLSTPKKGFLLNIDHTLIMLQWFLKDQWSVRFFKVLMRNKLLVFDIEQYCKTKDITIFYNYQLPDYFYDFVEYLPFFVENLFSQKFLFYFLTFLENNKYYAKNNYGLLNSVNCLAQFNDNEENFKKRLNFEGIFKSLIWLLVESFQKIFKAIPDSRRGKIVFLQKFSFLYKILLKNMYVWPKDFSRVIEVMLKRILNAHMKKNAITQEIKEFFLEDNPETAFLIFIVMIHLSCKKNQITEKHLLNVVPEEKKEEEKVEEKKTENGAENIISQELILKKSTFLILLFEQLDALEFEQDLDENFLIFSREKCLKTIFHLIEREKTYAYPSEIPEISLILNSYFDLIV